MMNRRPAPNLMAMHLMAAMQRPSLPLLAPELPTTAPIGVEPLNLTERYDLNTRGHDFVVGSLNGCYDLFLQLLEMINFDKAVDRMFCTGNLIDHGPDSVKCLALLNEPWFRAVAGSREQLLLDAACKPNFDRAQWAAKGGAWAASLTRDALVDLAAIVADLPLAIIVGAGAPGRFNVIHAEYNGPDEALEDALEDITTGHPVPRCLTWGHDLIDGKADPAEHDGLSLTFVGHTMVAEVGRIGSHIFIDTGAFMAERGSKEHGLTCIEPATSSVYTVRPQSRILLA